MKRVKTSNLAENMSTQRVPKLHPLGHVSPVQALLWLAAICFLPSVLFADSLPPQQAWLVKDYRYVPGSDQDNPETGLALCGTRCNAMTTDYRNVIDPGGYRYIRVAENKELTVPLDNPFIGGECICVADEYVIRVNDLTGPEVR